MKIRILQGKSKKIVMILVVIVCSYLLFTWDYHLSNLMFERLCSDPNKIGLFIYEKVELPDEYWEPLPTAWEHPHDFFRDRRFEYPEGEYEENFFDGKDGVHKKGVHYRFFGGYRINKDRLAQDYEVLYYATEVFSRIGPIKLSVSSVTRKSDGFLLGKAVSARNIRGWVSDMHILSSGNPGIFCPNGQDDLGSLYRRDHGNLVRSIFSK